MRILSWVLVGMTCSTTLIACQRRPQTDVVSFIPEGDVAAIIMAPAFPARCEELTAKMQAAVQLEPEWWMEHVKNSTTGQPLPYHPKMGLSEAEYKEMLACGDSMAMQKLGETHLRVTTTDGRIFKFDAEDPLLGLNGIELDLEKDEVRTPLGIASVRSSIVADASQQAATGPWAGVQWKLEPNMAASADPQSISGTIIRFSLGRLESGDGILYYNAHQVESGIKVARVLTVLYYPLPASSKST